MRKKYYLLVALFFALASLHAYAQKALVVKKTDGNLTTFVLSDKPVVSFAGVNIMVKSEVMEASFVQVDVEKFYFVDVETGMNEVNKSSDVRIDFTQEDLVAIYGTQSGASLYDMSGRCVVRSVSNGVVQQVDLSGLPSGTYVLKVANQSNIKILKK